MRKIITLSHNSFLMAKVFVGSLFISSWAFPKVAQIFAHVSRKFLLFQTHSFILKLYVFVKDLIFQATKVHCSQIL